VPAAGLGLRRMLITLDGSEFSESILEPALGLARTLGMRVTLLRALYSSDPADRALALAYLEAVAGRFPDDLPPPKLLAIPHRSPAEAIFRTSTSGNYDLVAMATHGQGGIRHRVVGSTADEVLRGTTHPVLMFRPESVAARWYLAAREAFAPA
jgi:nucleotide-binding universal stress UspA family protein